ncbi:flotillin family protein YqiK [Thermosynechococcus sp. NK55a]|nr:flotillin family protein YqiK [Thermosynechococcus sp. NK55a]
MPPTGGDWQCQNLCFANGGSTADFNKLLLFTSGLALVNALFEEGKPGQLLAQIKSLLQDSTSNS